MEKTIFLMGIALYALSPFLVYGQLLDPVDYTLSGAPDTVKAGEVFEVSVEASIDDKWHLYSILNDPDVGPYPTQFSSVTAELVIAGKVMESEAVTAFDPNFNTELGWHSRAATFTIPVTFDSSLQGTQPFTLEVLYQVCDDRSCLPPKTKEIKGEVILAGVADNPFQRFSEESADKDNFGFLHLNGIDSVGTWGLLILAILAGFLSLLTPRLFPLIPLTVSSFLNQKNQPGRVKAFRFGFFAILIFTSIGTVASLILKVIGVNQFASNPWLNLGIGILLIVFGVSLLGIFELRIPYRLTNWFNRKSIKSRGMGAEFFTVLTVLSVSFSSTIPFVGTIVLLAALGEWFYPVVSMLGFSAAFASLFILLTIFPENLESIPRRGTWLHVSKIVSGLLVCAVALIYLAKANMLWY